MSEDYINNVDFGDEEEFELSETRIRLNELIHEISSNPDYDGCIFNDHGWYFTISNDEISLLSDTVECDVKGGLLDTFTGPSKEEHEFFDKLMEEIGFDQYFFDDAYNECFGYIEEKFLEYFADGYDEEDEDYADEEPPENLLKFKAIVERVESDDSPFRSMDDFVESLRMYDLEPDVYYYEWEGEYIELLENITDCGDSFDDYVTEDDEFEEWIETLENIDNYKL